MRAAGADARAEQELPQLEGRQVREREVDDRVERALHVADDGLHGMVLADDGSVGGEGVPHVVEVGGAVDLGGVRRRECGGGVGGRTRR